MREIRSIRRRRAGGRLLTFSIGLVILFGFSHARAQEDLPKNCLICEERLQGRVWKYPQGLICDDCHRVDERCAVCGLPARENHLTTPDGRVICEREADRVIVDERRAIRIFETVQRQLVWITEGRLKLANPDVQVELFQVDYWNYREGEPIAKDRRRTGISRTRKIGDRFIHHVLLLSAQLPDELQSVCAHEYAHLWIHENKPAERQLESDTTEGLCELVAWKLMQLHKNEKQQEKIRANSYTRGKIVELIDLETRYGFYNILDWVKNGSGDRLDEPALRRHLNKPVGEILAASLDPARNEPPQTLELKGIFHSRRPLALINGQTLSVNQTAAVNVGSKVQRITCLEILEDRVTIRIEDSREIRVLKITED